MSDQGSAWMPLYVADYLRDTMHLSTEQHGAYLLLIMAAWTRGGKLPDDPQQLAAMAKMSASAWRRVAPAVLAFFHLTDGVYTHKRITAEFEKAQRLVLARRANGAKGGRPPKLNGTGEKATGSVSPKLTKTPARVRSLPSPSSVTSVTGAESADLGLPSGADPGKRAWALALVVLTEQGGMKEAPARAYFGKLLSENALKPQSMLEALEAAQRAGTQDPRAYLSKAASASGRAEARHLAIVRSNIQ